MFLRFGLGELRRTHRPVQLRSVALHTPFVGLPVVETPEPVPLLRPPRMFFSGLRPGYGWAMAGAMAGLWPGYGLGYGWAMAGRWLGYGWAMTGLWLGYGLGYGWAMAGPWLGLWPGYR